MRIEDELFEAIQTILSKATLKRIDNDIIYMLNVVCKKIEGPVRTIPYSKAKVQRRVALLFWKARKKQLQNKQIDIMVLEKWQQVAEIRNIETISIK